MISLLARIFIKPETLEEPALRKAYGILCSAVGIGLNLVLFAVKFFAGTLSGSVAIVADALNNLSDAGSSIVTLLGFYLAGQKPDPHHPFGHGRIEYVSGFIVSMLILLLGVEVGKSAVEKILHPSPVAFEPVVPVLLCLSIAIKLYMVFYNRVLGKKLNSPAMLAVSADSASDCVATFAVLLAMLVSHRFGVVLDGWCGMAVALFILFSGIRSAKETLDPLLGTPPSRELVEEIESLVLSFPSILRIHDLIVHDYGPGRRMISLHAEVPANADLLKIHDEIDNVEKELRSRLSCEAVIHMDPVITDDGITSETRRRVEVLVRCIDEAISIHDFRMVMGPTHTNVIFDAVVPFQFRLSDEEVGAKIASAVRTLDGNYYAVVNVEHSYT